MIGVGKVLRVWTRDRRTGGFHDGVIALVNHGVDTFHQTWYVEVGVWGDGIGVSIIDISCSRLIIGDSAVTRTNQSESNRMPVVGGSRRRSLPRHVSLLFDRASERRPTPQ